MPYAVLKPAQPESRLAAAAARWDAVLGARPELAPAVELQRKLIALIIERVEEFEKGRPPRLSLPGRYLAAKLARGVPALVGEQIPLPIASLKPTLLRLCQALSAGGAGAAADRIGSAIEEASIDATSLLTASLARNQNAIRMGADHRGLAADLLWLVAELAVSPFVHSLQQTLLGSGSVHPDLAAALAAWEHGYCPACGSWPALAEMVDARRVLRCSFCAVAWELTSAACVYCGESGDRYQTTAPDKAQPDRRVELCGTCAGYLKVVDVPRLSYFPLLAIADLETTHLDMTAMAGGHHRPPLKEFLRTGDNPT